MNYSHLMTGLPDGSFDNFGASGSVLRRFWTTYNSQISWAWGSKIVHIRYKARSVRELTENKEEIGNWLRELIFTLLPGLALILPSIFPVRTSDYRSSSKLQTLFPLQGDRIQCTACVGRFVIWSGDTRKSKPLPLSQFRSLHIVLYRTANA